jgi:hypothetical protein
MTAAQTQAIDSQERKYYHMMLNMADDDLDPYEYRLLGHYRRVCGENGNPCEELTRVTAAICHMSTGTISKTRKALESKGWIELTYVDVPGTNLKTIHVSLVDRWRENVERYTSDREPRTGSPHEPVHKVNGSPHEQHGSPGEQPSRDTGSPGEQDLINNIYKNQVHKNRGATAPRARKPKPVDSAPKPIQPHIAIIDAWYDGMPAPPVTRKYPRNAPVAKRILVAGYTPEQVKACTEAKYAKSRSPDSQIKLEWIEDDLPLWVKAGQNGNHASHPSARRPSRDGDRTHGVSEEARRKAAPAKAFLERQERERAARLSHGLPAGGPVGHDSAANAPCPDPVRDVPGPGLGDKAAPG